MREQTGDSWLPFVQYLADVGFKMELEILDDPWARFRTWNTDSPGGGEVSLTGYRPMWPNPDTMAELDDTLVGLERRGLRQSRDGRQDRGRPGGVDRRARGLMSLSGHRLLELQEKLSELPGPNPITRKRSFSITRDGTCPSSPHNPARASTADIFYCTNQDQWRRFGGSSTWSSGT